MPFIIGNSLSINNIAQVIKKIKAIIIIIKANIIKALIKAFFKFTKGKKKVKDYKANLNKDSIKGKTIFTF